MTSADVVKIRKRIGKSQEEFAEIIGSSRAAVQRYEQLGNIPGVAARVIEAVVMLHDCGLLEEFIDRYVVHGG